MNRKYNLKLDLQFRCNNSIMKFNQFDNNTSDFFIKISNGGKSFDVEKAIVVLAIIKPSGKVASQFVEVENGLVYADLKPSMKDEIGTYTAKAMLILEDERVVTDVISYKVEEDKIFSLLNDTVEDTEDFTLLTDMLNRLSTIEISEEQRMINEAERILSEENRKIEEAKRVEAELIRQHEEADRSKYDATRESNENIRKQNESIRLANETNRIDEEAKRVEEEAKRVEAEQLRKDNYNFMTEDEERRRVEANAHKEAEKLRAQAETNRVNEEAKRRTTEQARVSAENTRVSNENTRKANETTRQTNETHRVEAETQRQNRYNSFIVDAEANANNFENYTNTAKVKEEERKSNELDRKSQEDRRVSNEVERISNENTRKANEKARQNNETTRQNTFANKVNEVDKKIIELNTTKDNFVSSISTKVDNKISEIDNVKDNFVSSVNTKVDSKISELDTAKSDMTNTVANKVNEVENRFNALTSKQQQDAEVVDARDGETSLKARLDRDIEKAKQVYAPVEGSHISTDSSVGYAKDIEILGNTIQSASNLADIKSVGDKVEGQELYEIPVLSNGKNLLKIADSSGSDRGITFTSKDGLVTVNGTNTGYVGYDLVNGVASDKLVSYSLVQSVRDYYSSVPKFINKPGNYTIKVDTNIPIGELTFSVNILYDDEKHLVKGNANLGISTAFSISVDSHINGIYVGCWYSGKTFDNVKLKLQIEEGTQATPYEPYQEDKLTILSPTPLEKVGDIADRIIEKDGVWGVEKNVETIILDKNSTWTAKNTYDGNGKKYYGSANYAYNFINSLSVSEFPSFSNGQLARDYNGTAIVCSSVWGTIDYSVNIDTLEEFKSWVDGRVLKVQSTQPQFIPLAHSQQIKLRTFANKTNISFGCEIEGTIKAQVPKSLGATVNTHTEQINNLNKELDRVKKLEESTVSTVTTESDFTIVEATSGGYFDDVKLEGKTLVNKIGELEQGYISGSTGESLTSPNRVRTKNCISLGDSITIITNFMIQEIICFSNDTFVKSLVGANINKNIYKVDKSNDFNQIKVVFKKSTNENVLPSELKNIILEGDHTQNPPSGYIEGLKSVGQDVDEIVVSSVNENLVLNCNFHEENEFNYAIRINEIKSRNLHISNPFSKQIDLVIFNYNTNSWVRNIEVFPNTFINIELNLEECIRFINFPKKVWSGNNDYVSLAKHMIIGTDTLNIDKKRLLYFNTETQAWENPILREWDSIEKHTDGKYYYHQRSGEGVFDGLEADIRVNADLGAVTRFFVVKRLPNCKGQTNGKQIFDRYGFDANFTGAYVHAYLDADGNAMIFSECKTVEAFKSELQTNNVTVVYQLAQEKVYECTNIDLITYANETNFIVESGVLSPKTTLKVHSNISNVVSLLQKKVSLLENNITSYMITQNRLMLASRYNADNVTFKVDYPSMMSEREVEIDYDLFKLIQDNIIVGPENYDVDKMLEIMDLYAMIGFITWEMWDYLYEVIDSQINPVIGDLEGAPEI